MAHYQRRPARIEAWQVPPIHNPDLDAIAHATGGRIVHDAFGLAIELTNDHGDLLARPGDFVIRQPDGEAYPCKAAKFHDLYELAGEGAA